MLKHFLSSVILFSILNACSSSGIQEASTSSINESQKIMDRYWKLITMSGKQVLMSNGTKKSHIKFFDDGETTRLAGFAGCNRIMGKYVANNSTINIRTLTSTKMTCPKMEEEQELIRLLDTSDSYQVDDDKLLLFSNNVLILTFEEMEYE